MGHRKPIGPKTILIVEDEALVRFNAAAFFEDEGWEVYEAANADQAIALLDGNTVIRVVLTDVQMPGTISGLKLAHYVRDRFPPTLVFVTSGHAPVPREALPLRATFVSKPFDLNHMLRQIERAAA